MTFKTREVPSIPPEKRTIVNKTSKSVKKASEETTLLKLKIYNTNIIEAVRTFIIIFLVFVKSIKL